MKTIAPNQDRLEKLSYDISNSREFIEISKSMAKIAKQKRELYAKLDTRIQQKTRNKICNEIKHLKIVSKCLQTVHNEFYQQLRSVHRSMKNEFYRLNPEAKRTFDFQLDKNPSGLDLNTATEFLLTKHSKIFKSIVG